MLGFLHKGLATLKKTLDEGRLAREGVPDSANAASTRAAEPTMHIARGATKKSHKRRSSSTDAGRASKAPRPAAAVRERAGARVYIMQADLRAGFLVLVNDGRERADLSRWTLRGGESGAVVHKLPEGTAIEARSVLVVLSPTGQTPAAFQNERTKELRSPRAWPDALLLHDSSGTIIDGEADSDSTFSAPYGSVVSRAEKYYRDLVSQLVSQRLFAKSPSMVGPSSVSAESVRFTYDTRTHIVTLLEQYAGHLARACVAETGASAGATAVCSAVEDALPACDVQRRAVAEVARSAEHAELFLIKGDDARKIADAQYSANAGAPKLDAHGAHALGVAVDYFLVELIETVATIAFAETTSPGSQGDAHAQTSDFCIGALDKLSLQMAIRMDPDLNKICSQVDSRPARLPATS